MTQTHHIESLLGDDWPAPQTQLSNIAVTLIDKRDEIEMEVGGPRQDWTFNIWKLREIPIMKPPLKQTKLPILCAKISAKNGQQELWNVMFSLKINIGKEINGAKAILGAILGTTEVIKILILLFINEFQKSTGSPVLMKSGGLLGLHK